MHIDQVSWVFVMWRDSLTNHLAEKERERYCRFGNFRENFIFVNSIKRHIGDLKNSRQSKIYLYQ